MIMGPEADLRKEGKEYRECATQASLCDAQESAHWLA